MGCSNPLLGVVTGFDPVTGSQRVSVSSFSDERLKSCIDHDEKYFFIPCGKCLACRLDYSRQWANRMMMELQYHDSAYFVTLTYSDVFLPYKYMTDPCTGEIIGKNPTLKKDHLSRFVKHVRKHFKYDRIRFFGSGEYGTSTFRPHYHIVLFGLHLSDCVEYKRTKQGNILYTSAELNCCWSNFFGYDSSGSPRYDQIGFVIVAPVTWETCAYVARYTAKKASFELENKIYQWDVEPPFSLSSRRPGIGYQWFKDHPDCLKYDFINLSTPTKGIKFRPPKYFRVLERQDRISKIVKSRSERSLDDVSSDLIDFKLSSEVNLENFYGRLDALLEIYDGPYSSYLANQDFNLHSRTKILDRSTV